MIRYFCDACNEELKKEKLQGNVLVTIKKPDGNIRLEHYYLCESCLSHILEMMKKSDEIKLHEER